MFVKYSRKMLVVCLIVCLGIAGYISYLAWEGYIFPVRYVEYFPDGEVSLVGHHVRENFGGGIYEWGDRGKFVSYYPGGRVGSIGEYDSNGCPVGEWIQYKEDGTVETAVDYGHKDYGIFGIFIYAKYFRNVIAFCGLICFGLGGYVAYRAWRKRKKRVSD